MPVYTIVGVDKIFLPRCPVVVTAPSGQLSSLAEMAGLAHWCIMGPISWTHHLAGRRDQDSTSCAIFVVPAAEEGTSVYKVPACVCCVENHTQLESRKYAWCGDEVKNCHEPVSVCVQRRGRVTVCVIGFLCCTVDLGRGDLMEMMITTGQLERLGGCRGSC